MELSNKIKLIVVFILILAIILIFLTHIIINHHRINQLIKQEYYCLYSTFDPRYELYIVFMMINENSQKNSDLEHWARKIVTNSYINQLRSDKLYLSQGEYPIKIHLISPSNELPFGWEKDELNIEMNFDQSVFYRNTHLIVTIPISANNFSDCKLEVNG